MIGCVCECVNIMTFPRVRTILVPTCASMRCIRKLSHSGGAWCVIEHLWKWHPIQHQIFAVIKTVFAHTIWSYHLGNCRPEFYYECDWNGARISVIVQQSNKWSVWKIIWIIIIIIMIIMWWRFCQFCHSTIICLNDNLWSSRGCW